MNDEYLDNVIEKIGRYFFSWRFVRHVVIFLVLIFGIRTFFSAVRIVQPGFVGVSVFLGEAKNEGLSEGMHLVIPWLTKVYPIDTRIQKVEASSFEAASKDLQSVKAAIIVNYSLKKDLVVALFREIGEDYPDIVIKPGIAETYKATTANFTAESLITERQIVSEQIKKSLAERLEPHGIIITQVNIVNFAFSQEFDKAIEAKVTAIQEALKAEKELEKVKFMAMQAEEKSKGEARAAIEKAKGDAEAILEKAKAEAESLQLRLQYAKPEIIMLEAITKWSGELPKMVVLGGNGITPILDVGREIDGDQK